MSKTLEDLQREMEAAARSLDFEEARRLRDRINLLRGGANAAEAAQAAMGDGGHIGKILLEVAPTG